MPIMQEMEKKRIKSGPVPNSDRLSLSANEVPFMALLESRSTGVATYDPDKSKLRHNFGLHDDTRCHVILR